MVGEVLGPPLFCSDGERAENSIKQAELLGGYTAYSTAIGPIVAILGSYRRTRHGREVHIRGTSVRRSPKVAICAHPDCRSAIEATGNRQREHSLEAEWAGAGGYGRTVISVNGLIKDSKLVGWGGVEATDWEAPA